MDDTRFYSFVAGLYLSPLQRGLQTAHAVSEMYLNYRSLKSTVEEPSKLFDQWASVDKTIIILDVGNSKGVKDVMIKLRNLVIELPEELPVSIFYEDEDSLNGAATAAGVVVPKKYFGAQLIRGDVPEHDSYEYVDEDGRLTVYASWTAEFEFISFIKSYRLAQS